MTEEAGKQKVSRTCAGECRETRRSCCNVRSTVLCFWKFWSAFEGPHMESAMMSDMCLHRIKKWSEELLEELFRVWLYCSKANSLQS